MAPLQDPRGCLTAAGLEALRAAPPGGAPPELVRHVAACQRCQDRILAADEGALGPGRRKPPPPRWRLLVLLLVAVSCALLMFGWLRRVLSGEP